MAKKKAAKAAKAKKAVKKLARSPAKKARPVTPVKKKAAKATKAKKAAPRVTKKASRTVKAARQAAAAPRKSTTTATSKSATARRKVARKSVTPRRSIPRQAPPTATPIDSMMTRPFLPAAEPERGAKPFDPDAVEQEAGLPRQEHDDLSGFPDDDDSGLDDDDGQRQARAQQPPGPPQVGARAPEFDLQDQAGRRHTLALYRGQRVVLYFYPKDDTPGCTDQACGFRDALGDFSDHGAVVLGVSPDPVRSHARFAQKFGLTFPLLADDDHRVAAAYGVWVQKQMYGRRYMGVARTTFLIGPTGRIERVFVNVQPAGHEREVLAALTATS